MHVVDLMNVNSNNIHQANNLQPLTMIEIAPSGEAIALADSACTVYLWGSLSKIRFSELSNPIEVGDTDDNQIHLDWSVDT